MVSARAQYIYAPPGFPFLVDDAEALLGKPLDVSFLMGLGERLAGGVAQVRAGSKIREIEYTFAVDGQTSIYLLSRVSPVTDSDDILIVVDDITQRKHLEIEREKLIEDLDAFAHTVAHDLKNPLSGIVGYSSLLAAEFSTMLAEEIQESLNLIDQFGHKMETIIDNLLLLANVRRGTVKTERLDMEAIVGETLKRLAFVIEEYQAEIIVPDRWPASLGYGPWVEEVWANYISNALKYGGRPPRVELGATGEADGFVRFWVRDNGAGISQPDIAHLFAPFLRLNQANIKGYGLGLSIVQRIVEKLGGQTGVESNQGEGSVFAFTLPVPE